MGTIKFLVIFSLFFAFPFVVFPAAGDLDPTFDGDGIVNTYVGGYCCAEAVALQPDGKIIAAGATGSSDFALIRYNPDGSLDTTFGGTGIVTTDFGLTGDLINAVTVQSDGKIIAAGHTTSNNNDFALARYNVDGSLDMSFNGNGKVTTDFNSSIDNALAVTMQPDGKIIAAGLSNINFAMVRYNPDGSLDTSFDGDGKVVIDFGSNSEANGVALQSDGKIVVAGYMEMPTDRNFALARLNVDGSLDSTFDGDGKVTTDFGGDSIASGIVLQSDGKIITAGTFSNIGSSDFALARYNTNGSLDLTFDFDGKATTDFASKNDYANGVVLQSDGKIVLGGGTNGPSYDFGMARYNSDGSLDLTFSGDGKVTSDLGSMDEGVMDITLQPDGKVILAGGSDIGNNHVYALARYQSDQCLFCDDFEDGVLASNWTYAKPQWNEAGGNLIGTPAARKAETIATPAFSGCDTCSVSTSISSSGGLGNKVWLLSWFMDSKNTFEILMKEENDKWVLKQRVGGSVVAKAKGIAQIDPNVFYNVVVSFDGANFRLAVNGVLLCTMPAFSSPSGTVGFRVKNTTGSFGFIAVN